MKRGLIVIWTAICLVANLCLAAPTTFDVAADFSATNNPNGVWSYGWSSTLTSALNLYPDIVNYNNNGLDVWTILSWGCPNVSHNGTGSAINIGIIWQPGQFSLHPGGDWCQNEYSHARWTAPYAGTFDIASMFTGIDTTTTDVHVLHNDTSLFDGLVNGLGNTSSFSTTVSVGMGDIIDFAVGYGSNQHNSCDSTGLSATISAIPAPGALILGGIGAGFVGWLRRRRTL